MIRKTELLSWLKVYVKSNQSPVVSQGKNKIKCFRSESAIGVSDF